MTLIDWNNPPTLRVRKRPGRDLDALSASHARRVKRKSGKAHATNKDRALAAKAKAAKLKKFKTLQSQRRKTFLAAVRAYWRGEGDHP